MRVVRFITWGQNHDAVPKCLLVTLDSFEATTAAQQAHAEFDTTWVETVRVTNTRMVQS